mmetsp:Transcript_50403/g.98793  ORF Transcript_50403/g.98793 Transcript_50403/m.98793 type:complete len:83 (-) Transcript_50403:790-1038(-)
MQNPHKLRSSTAAETALHSTFKLRSHLYGDVLSQAVKIDGMMVLACTGQEPCSFRLTAGLFFDSVVGFWLEFVSRLSCGINR